MIGVELSMLGITMLCASFGNIHYFQRHFQRMCDDLGNRMCTFGLYFLKEGVYTLIGAETAQGLPNGKVYYAFIREAGKQYGVLL